MHVHNLEYKVGEVEKPRQIAARILQRYDAGQDYLDHLLEDELGRTPLRPEDRGLCQELIFGVVRWQSALDALIAKARAERAGS